jgi:hypothetical protein
MRFIQPKSASFWIRAGLLVGIIACLYFSSFGDPVRTWIRSQIGNPLRICLRKSSYYSWIENDRPYLGKLGSNRILGRKVEFYSKEGRLYPYVFYDVVYGDTDGIFELAYILDIEKNFSPKGILKQDFSVRLLPASEQRKVNGRIRNVYWGRYIEPRDVAAIADRICSGDRLLDIKESIEHRPDYPDICWADTDPWVKLTSNRKINPIGPGNATSPSP